MSDVLKAYEQKGLNDENLLLVTLSGLIGDSLAVAFIQSSLGEEESIPADSILREYEKARSMVQHWVRKKRLDLLNSSAHSVMLALQDSDTASDVLGMATLSRNLDTFLGDLPADIAKKVRKVAKQTGAIK